MSLRHRIAGRAATLYWRLLRPRTIGARAIVIDARGRIALVRHTYLAGWYLPGGGVDKGESAGAAIVRELREELALEVDRIDHVLGVYHNRREAKDDHVVVFVIRIATSDDRLVAADLREIAEAGWFADDALPAGVSPATKRRITEFRGLAPLSDEW